MNCICCALQIWNFLWPFLFNSMSKLDSTPMFFTQSSFTQPQFKRRCLNWAWLVWFYFPSFQAQSIMDIQEVKTQNIFVYTMLRTLGLKFCIHHIIVCCYKVWKKCRTKLEKETKSVGCCLREFWKNEFQ